MFFCSPFSNSIKTNNEKLKFDQNESSLVKTENENLKNLDQLTWKNRIILVKDTGNSALEQLTENKNEIDERHVIWFGLSGGKIKTNYPGKLEDQFVAYLQKNFFNKFEKNVFLIGKDGGIKSKDDSLDLQNYFGQIDSMPMRKQEMR
jgi:hypothetical protein